jgi:hypothetical protein
MANPAIKGCHFHPSRQIVFSISKFSCKVFKNVQVFLILGLPFYHSKWLKKLGSNKDEIVILKQSKNRLIITNEKAKKQRHN